MYNRYIPQSDGSYRKNVVPGKEPPCQSANIHQEPPLPTQSTPVPPIIHANPPKQAAQRRSPKPLPPAASDSIPQFIKQLIPKDLDTGDLLVIVLLLLMAGDCKEDRSHALLTLVLYLFL